MATKKRSAEEALVKQIVDGEYTVEKANRDNDNRDFESYVDLLDSVRSEKEYDWRSDIRIPEFVSHQLTQNSLDVQQYFTTRDFVEVYIQDPTPVAKASAEAEKELQNRTLNQRELFHYPKFVRAKIINNLVGKVYAKCSWVKRTAPFRRPEQRVVETGMDVFGEPLTADDQIPATQVVEEMVDDIKVVEDRFNYEVYDQRNVFCDNSYTYSLQQKRWIIFRDEATLSDLRDSAEAAGYFNLDRLKAMTPPDKTETARESYDEQENASPMESAVEKSFDILERYGKFWVVVDKDDDGNPVYGTEKIGIGDDGKPRRGAELHHVIITIAMADGASELIGFKLSPFIDATGRHFMPCIRGLCYIHPTYDGGMGDGKHTKELQVAIDDTFNIAQDRVMLATIPTLKGRKQSIEENDSIYFKPQHVMSVNEPDDIEEFKISDDTQGALAQLAMLENKMRQVDSIQPPSMGQTPDLASTTATAVAAASQGTNSRNQYKSMTFEYTFLTELYWMISNMTYRFAEEDTMLRLMGEKVYDFNPSLQYFYKPLSQSIEPEHSKINKRKDWETILGYVIQIQHPDAVRLVNFCFSEIVKLMGDEYENAVQLNPNVPMMNGPTGGGQMGEGGMMAGASNQNGVPMGGMQAATRTMANE